MIGIEEGELMLLMRKLKSCSYFAFTKSAQLKLTMMKLIWTYEPFPASFPFLALSHLPKYCKSYSDFSPNKPRQSLVKQSKLLKNVPIECIMVSGNAILLTICIFAWIILSIYVTKYALFVILEMSLIALLMTVH